MSAEDPAADAAEPCAFYDALCKARGGLGDAVAAASDNVVANLAREVSIAVGEVVKSLGTLWVNVDTPNLVGTGAGADTVGFLRDSLAPYMIALAMVSVMVGAGRMAWEQRGTAGKDLLFSLMRLVAIAGAGVAVIALLVAAADDFSQWIIGTSTQGTDFGTNITALLVIGGRLTGGVSSLMVIILGVLAIIGSIIQIMLMVVRAGMLVILAGVLPLTAAFTSTEMGKMWLRRSIGWTVAFIAYKPAAAIVYATAFRLTGSDVFGDDGTGILNVITGLGLMVLALIALPALMRFVAPMVAQLSGGGGGGGMGAALAVALPSGAASIVSMMRGSGGGGGGAPSGGGPSGPSGSSGSSGSSGGGGPSGGPGPSGTSGTSGTSGASAAPAAASSAAPATAGAGAGATAGAGAGAVAGPVGMAAGAVASTAISAGKAAGSAVKQGADEATGGGPSGSS